MATSAGRLERALALGRQVGRVLDVLAALDAVAAFGYFAIFPSPGLAVAVTSWVMLDSRRFPAWIGWLGLVAGVAAAASVAPEHRVGGGCGAERLIARQDEWVTSLQLCGGTLPIDDGEALLLSYLDPASGYAWPDYDTLVTNDSTELVGADLLAPVLLGAHIDRPRYRLLLDLLPELAGVTTLPEVALQDASDEHIDEVAALFALVDREVYRRRGVKGTILSKVLHRKRPDLVPLYDSRIYAAYTAEGAIHRDSQREWREFMAILLRHMREDLQREAAAFARLAHVASEEGADLTHLRILDILVWMSLDDV